MNAGLRSLLLAAGIALASTPVQAQDKVFIANVVELSGGGASAGTQWRDAVEMAKDEINEGGGILGRRIEIRHYDSQTNPTVSRAQVQKALDDNPYAILGTIYSGSTVVNMLLTQAAEVPQFTGAQAAEITQKGNPYIFRANMGQQFGMPKIAKYLRENVQAKKVAIIYVADSFGKGGRDQFFRALAGSGIEITAEVSTQPDQVDFTADLVTALKGNPDALFVYLHEDESARLLRTARQQNVKIPLIGETTLFSQKAIDLAGGAADGARGFVPLTADAPSEPVMKFRRNFEKRFGYTPAHAAMSGYISLHAVKAVTQKMGKFDRKEFARTLKNLTITTAMEPGILVDSRWDENGDVERETYIVEVVGGKQVVKDVIRPNFQTVNQ